MGCYHDGMVRTQISMTESQAAGLRRVAAERGMSQSAVLREALDLILSGSERERRLAHARWVVGRHRSAPGRTAERHDEALAEVFGG